MIQPASSFKEPPSTGSDVTGSRLIQSEARPVRVGAAGTAQRPESFGNEAEMVEPSKVSAVEEVPLRAGSVPGQRRNDAHVCVFLNTVSDSVVGLVV